MFFFTDFFRIRIRIWNVYFGSETDPAKSFGSFWIRYTGIMYMAEEQKTFCIQPNSLLVPISLLQCFAGLRDFELKICDITADPD